ncbi:MAG: hypothetical protein EOP39_04360 [Rubrivivax sp.]|nr:MAG: hypothetical protein EOP39_04360 [Rubrivivax sp.]
MTVHAFPVPPPQQGEPVTWAQAQEMFSRYFVDMEAVPTLAHRMGVDYDVACRVLNGKIHPGARRQWLDKVLP